MAAGGAAAGAAACSRARLLKLLLAVLGAVAFLEYVSGLLMEGGRTVTLYSSNASIIRNTDASQWPKRTHGRHCFDDHILGDRVLQATNITPTLQTRVMESGSEGKNPAAVVNIHNATQRARVFSAERANRSADGNDIDTVNRTSDGDISVNNSSTPRSEGDVESMGSTAESAPEAGCNVPCPPTPPGLGKMHDVQNDHYSKGPITANLTEISLKDLEFSHIDIEEGGRYAPRNCKPHDKVAIIIPYRDRESHLAIFLNNLHPFLMKQQIDYQIFIVEQRGKAKFNRATLMNVGFVESLRLRAWDCFIFHDVDLIPLDDRNLYTCPQQPRHLSAAIDKFQFKLPYRTIFGGVSALTTEQFKKVNGFSNSFWGWGGEDDDMANRIIYHNFHISRYPMSVARYTMLDHEKEKPNQERYNLLMKGKQLFNTDGLNSLQYTLVESRLHHLYTQLLVELHPPS